MFDDDDDDDGVFCDVEDDDEYKLFDLNDEDEFIGGDFERARDIDEEELSRFSAASSLEGLLLVISSIFIARPI